MSVEPPGAWRSWFRSVRPSPVVVARGRLGRRAWLDDAGGSRQVVVADLGAGGEARIVTAWPSGVLDVALDPGGGTLWWFAAGHDESGRWMTQPFEAGPAAAEPAAPDGVVAPARGRWIGRRRSLVGRATASGAVVEVVERAERAVRALRVYEADARAVCLDDGERLAAVVHRAGPSGQPTAEVVDLSSVDAATVAVRSDDAGTGLVPVAFVPGRSDTLLCAVTRDDRTVPALWRLDEDELVPLAVGVPGDLTADWWPGRDRPTLVMTNLAGARSGVTVAAVDVETGALVEAVAAPVPPGSVTGWAPRPDGGLEVTWSSNERPWQRLRVGDEPRVAPGTPPPAELRRLTVAGPGGPIPVLVAGPETDPGGSAPPAVFVVHGGPAIADLDAWDPVRAGWAHHGYRVVHVNYRGSSGSGTRWLRGNHGNPGLAELEDLVAVRAHLVADGLVDGERVVLAGRSWGGYLALLGLGVTPDLWALGLALVPIGDTALVYADMLEEIRTSYRERFGGDPDTAPEAYRRSSPLTYVGGVRVPVLVTGARDDPRCPLPQIEAWVDAAVEAGVDVEFHVAPGGHTPHGPEEQLALMDLQLDFVRRHLTGP